MRYLVSPAPVLKSHLRLVQSFITPAAPGRPRSGKVISLADLPQEVQLQLIQKYGR